MNTEQELRPCPFCGGTNILVLPRTCDQNTPYDPNDRAMPAVRCMTCYGEAVGKDWTGPETAIAAWNRRSPAVAGGVAEALNAAREWINAADHDEHCFTNDPNPDACRCVCDKDSVIALIDDVTASLAVGDEQAEVVGDDEPISPGMQAVIDGTKAKIRAAFADATPSPAVAGGVTVSPEVFRKIIADNMIAGTDSFPAINADGVVGDLLEAFTSPAALAVGDKGIREGAK